MDEMPSSSSPIVDFIKKNILFVGLTGVGLILSTFGLFQYFSTSNESELEFVESSNADIKGVESVSNITVDVSGSVKNPGVYTLEPGSRVADALAKAGGMTSEADADYVAKRLNLAQKIPDGAKIYIPVVGERNTDTSGFSSAGSSEAIVVADTSSSLININNASESQLDTLPKVGPVTAKKIIDGRPYTSVDELVSKKVLTQKTFEGLKDRISAE